MSKSTIFQSCQDGAATSWVLTSTLGELMCLAQGHNMVPPVGIKPRFDSHRRHRVSSLTQDAITTYSTG